LQKIDHKNILQIYDVIETNNHVNIIMEYISGISLNTYLKSQPSKILIYLDSRLAEKDARKIMIPLIEAMDYLHSHSICHRDIKL
jgi:serine/threonine protein kinase